MWSDILKAVEILVKVLSGGGLETKRRRNFAKDLIRIYLDIDRLLVQGNWIISQLTNPNGTTLTAAAILDQLKIIQSLLDNLNNSKIESLIKIHLPTVAQLDHYSLAAKWDFLNEIIADHLVIDLSTLSTSRPVGKNPVLIGAENPEKVERELFLLSRDTGYREWRKAQASLHQWLLEEKQDRRREQEFSLIVRASFEDIEAAQDVLNAIAKAGEELRTFLHENFQMDDLIAAGTS